MVHPPARPVHERAARRVRAVAAGLATTLVVGLLPSVSWAATAPDDAATRCAGTLAEQPVPDESAALVTAAECGHDVLVSAGGDGDTRLWAQQDGLLRLETTATRRPHHQNDAFQRVDFGDRTVIGPTVEPITSGVRNWVGYCDPAVVQGDVRAGSCATATVPGVQRSVWAVPPVSGLEGVSAADVTRAAFITSRYLGIVDEVGCTPHVVEVHDLSAVTAARTWDAADDWDGSTRVAEVATDAGSCGPLPSWTSYVAADLTDAVVEAMDEGRAIDTVGLKAADETCMECGWSTYSALAALTVWFERPPFAPVLSVGNSYSGDGEKCSDDTAVLRSPADLHAVPTDPDRDANGSAGSMSVTFEVAAADAPDVVLWETTTSPEYEWRTHSTTVPPGVFVSGGRYVVRAWTTDDSGVDGPAASCEILVDRERPEPATIRPLLGYDAYYLPIERRGGSGVAGGFEVVSPSDDVAYFLWGTSSDLTRRTTASDGRAVLAVAPTYAGSGGVYVAAVDHAGNVSERAEYEFAVSWGGDATPPPITLSGPSGIAHDGRASYTVRVSDDAPAPYGTLTVRHGTRVLATVDLARTRTVTLPAGAVPIGTSTLTFTYQAVPGAKTWSTTRSLSVAKRAARVSTSVSSSWRYGTARRLAVTVTSAGTTPTGTVAVYRGSTKVGTAALSRGRATVTLGATALPAGRSTLSVRYLGSSTVATASSSRTVTVARASTTTTARLVDPTVRKPQRAKVTVTVTSPSSVRVTGKVAVKVDGRTVRTVRLDAADRERVVVKLPDSVEPGKHRVQAVYLGTGNFGRDASPTRSLKVSARR